MTEQAMETSELRFDPWQFFYAPAALKPISPQAAIYAKDLDTFCSRFLENAATRTKNEPTKS